MRLLEPTLWRSLAKMTKIFHVTLSEKTTYTVHVKADSLEDVEEMHESEFEDLDRVDSTSNCLGIDSIEDPDE